MAMDGNKFIGVLTTDMSKAFDSLQPPLLICKLREYGISEKVLDLFRSYFSQRMCRVKLGTTITSKWYEVNRGCPQGSKFGPLLWNTFQNDLTYHIKDSELTMYADDHQLYVVKNSIKNVQATLNNEVETVSRWYQDNLLCGNFDKYQAITLGPKNKDKDIELMTMDKKVKMSNELKILGVTIDDQLNFGLHISNICRSNAKRVGVLMRLRNIIPLYAKLQIYKSAIMPYLTYCHLVWHFSRASDCRKLERIQERALRAVYCDMSSEYNALLKRAKLPSLYNRRLQDIAILMFKVKNQMCPKYIQDLFLVNNSRYDLRNADFVIPRFNRVTYGKHSISYLGPVIWSKLNPNTKSITTLSNFRKGIRKIDLAELLKSKCNHNCVLCSS